MTYIRTKDNKIYKLSFFKEDKIVNGQMRYINKLNGGYMFFNILKQADTIEELCDEFVCQENDNFYWLASRENVSFRYLPNCYCKAIFGAIWTDKGLIYVAKMNDKGELELL